MNGHKTISEMANVLKNYIDYENTEEIIVEYIRKTRRDIPLSKEYERLTGLPLALCRLDKNDYRSLADNIALGLTKDMKVAYEIRDALYMAIDSGFSDSK